MVIYSYQWYQWFLFFYFYCFLGWCIESVFVSFKQKKFVNRGFLHAPLLPIYGSGAIIILFATLPVRTNPTLVFLFGALSATVLEYFTGVVMEKLFKVRYWDYSDKPFNFQGQICLTSTLAWGALSVVLIGFLHPPVENFVLRRIPRIPSIVLAAALSAVFVTDFAVSFRDAWGLGRILEKMTALKAEIAVLETHLRDLRQEQQDRLSGLKEGSAQWLLDRREEYAGRLHALRNDTLGWLSDFHNAKPSRLVEAKRSLDELTDHLYGEKWEQLRGRMEHLRASYASMRLPHRFGDSILKRNPTAVSKKFSEAFADYKKQIDSLRSKKNKD